MNAEDADNAADPGDLPEHISSRRLALVFLAIAVVSCVLVTFVAQHLAARNELARLNAVAGEAVALHHATLDGVFEKYRLMPAVLAKRDDLTTMLRTEPAVEVTTEATRLLREVTSLSGAQDAVVLDVTGTPVAAARNLVPVETWQKPAIREAITQRRLARAEIELVNGDRAYMFAAEVRDGDRSLGAVAVVVPFAAVNRAWALSRNPIFVTDRQNRIFLSNKPDWTGKIWSADSITNTSALARYDPHIPNRVNDPANVPHVDAIRQMPLLGWTLHVLVDARSIARARLESGAIALAAVLAFTLAALVGWRRRERRARQMRKDKAAAIRLERAVRDRTRDLSELNTALSHEVAERRNAEERLRSTQSELIHSAKLATIGQMAAALSHEYNQPLGAMKSYAENARTLIERDEPEKASDTVARITGLVDRMAALTRTFLTFSRKPGTEMKPVPVGAIVDEALVLVRNRLQKANATVDTQISPDAIALTGRTRLGQVVVNLINNALEACEGHTDSPEIAISAERHGDTITLSVADNGPGIDPQMQKNLFTPFFTTKADGHGLGLSIVESILRDLGGKIEAVSVPGAGARFDISLPAASAEPNPTDAKEARANEPAE